MAISSASIDSRPHVDRPDQLFRRCLAGSAVLGVLFLVAVLLTPMRELAVTRVEQVPPRLAKLILEEPQPTAAPSPKAARVEQPQSIEPATPEKPPESRRRAPRQRDVQKPKPDAGKVGRERAQKAVTQLASTTAALEKSLSGLSSSLKTTTTDDAAPKRRRRGRVRSGRSGNQVASVNADVGRGSADLGSSAVGGSLIAVGSLSSSESGGSGNPSPTEAIDGGSGPGVYRSNASLLAVVQKYAAGIQFCYENELKRDESLSGKLVVALTVAASGQVTEASIVRNTVGSKGLEACALSQIREWRFPRIDQGVTSFRAPFVFTPPK